ncbi:MAG TPA: lipopolysaccharide kinase InaA family protein [Candidatus Acidoferrales bacterium]|nr:lipopolysaccharide kinase InaA family protein [Candidatus Acidoferrales bacterium]
MRPTAQIQWRSDPAFTRVTWGRRELVIHRELAERAEVLIGTLGKLAGETGAGNRGSAFRVNLAGGLEIFARRARRGGLIRFFLSDIYVGTNPRPLRELAVTIEARRRGIAVAEPLGAMVEWVGPALLPIVYRGFFLTRAIAGMTLWEFVQTDDDPIVRSHVLRQAHAAIDTMHSKGLFHADLNLHNLMVTKSGESFAVIILDLDKSRLMDTAVPPGMRRANAARLIRSCRKLDAAGKYFDAEALSLLIRG